MALASAALGALVSVSLSVSHKQLCALISFAAGTLLGTTVFHIVPESWPLLSPVMIFIALGSGYLVFYLISRFISHVCPACSASHFDEHKEEKFKNIVLLLTIGLSVHSTMDGLAIAIGGHFGEAADHSIFTTILIHKFPEGLTLCALLLRAGYERLKALWMSIVFESTTLIGWILGVTLLKDFVSNAWLDGILLHVGGGFIYLALHAVLGEAKEHSPKLIVCFFLAGLLLIGVMAGVS